MDSIAIIAGLYVVARSVDLGSSNIRPLYSRALYWLAALGAVLGMLSFFA